MDKLRLLVISFVLSLQSTLCFRVTISISFSRCYPLWADTKRTSQKSVPITLQLLSFTFEHHNDPVISPIYTRHPLSLFHPHRLKQHPDLNLNLIRLLLLYLRLCRSVTASTAWGSLDIPLL